MKGDVKDALLHFKRAPFTRQKIPFYIAKGALLHCKRASIVLYMLIFYYIISIPRLCIYSLSVSYNSLFASHTVLFCKERIPIFHGKRVL